MDHLLDISVTCGGPYFLESVLEVSILVHLVVHLLLQKLTPQLLNLEVCPSSDFALIPVLIGGCLCNLLLLLDPVYPLLESLLLVLDAVLEPDNTLVPLLLLVLYVLHQVVQPVPRLQLLLLRHSLLLEFLFVDLIFTSQ